MHGTMSELATGAVSTRDQCTTITTGATTSIPQRRERGRLLSIVLHGLLASWLLRGMSEMGLSTYSLGFLKMFFPDIVDSFENQWMTLTSLSSHPIFIDGDPGDPIQAFSSNNSVCFKALEDLSLPDFIAAVELLLGCPERRVFSPWRGGSSLRPLPRSQVGGVATWSAIRGGSEFRHPLETHVQVIGHGNDAWVALFTET